MQSNKPAITVLMPAYNAEQYIGEAIASVLDQSFRNFELLIINDGSSDNTARIVAQFSDSRIRYIENERNLKLIKTLNKGIDLTQSKYLLRLDADDVALPNRFQLQYDFMEANPQVGLCGGALIPMNEPERIVRYKEKHQDILFKLLFANHFAHPAVIIRTAVLTENKLYFDEDQLHVEDYEMWWRMSSYCQLHNLREPIIKYRQHEGQVGAVYAELQRENDLLLRKQILKEISGIIDDKSLSQLCEQLDKQKTIDPNLADTFLAGLALKRPRLYLKAANYIRNILVDHAHTLERPYSYISTFPKHLKQLFLLRTRMIFAVKQLIGRG